jgi:DNA invertase Pin-like site-specific DNA recombinase
MTKKQKRLAIYVRVSTRDQNVERQRHELECWTVFMGHNVVKFYADVCP